jgi:serine/threonine-protein kinase
MLPQGYSDSACRVGDPQGPGGVARLDCGPNTKPGGPSGATYLTFSDQSSLDDAFDKVIASSNLELMTCPGLQEPSPTDWHLRTTPTVTEGQIACGKYKNQDLYTLTWTHDSRLFYGGGDSTDLDALYKWWQQYT